MISRMMVENIFALMTMTADTAGVTGYEASKVLDNKHYSHWMPATFAYNTTTEYDQTDNGANATFNGFGGGGPTRGNYFGQTNDGILFNGSSQYLTLASPLAIGYLHTIEVTIDTATAGLTQTIISYDHGGGKYSFVQIDATNIIYNINNGTNNFQKTWAHGGFTSGTAHRIHITRNGLSVSAYKDFVLISTQAFSAGLETSGFTFNQIGRHLTTNYFNGKMGKLRTYAFEASAAEITAQGASGSMTSKPLNTINAPSYMWEMNGAKPHKFTFDPTGVIATSQYDGVVLHPNMSDPHGHILVRSNGTRYMWSCTDYNQKGLYTSPVTLRYASGIPINAGQVTYVVIYAATTPKIKHIWGGKWLDIKFPRAPFDPEDVDQPTNTFQGRSGVVATNTPLYTKKALRATWTDLRSTDYTTLSLLYTKSFLKATPFWYAFLQDTAPQNTYLYNWTQGRFSIPYQGDGQHRSFEIEAFADYTPDRSTALL